MTCFLLARRIAIGALLMTMNASGARPITNILQLKLTLNKQQLRLGEELIGHFTITNASKGDVSVVRTGALYMSYWFRVEDSQRRVSAEPLFEKLFTDYVSREDVITLKPGRSFTVDRTATLRPSTSKSGRTFLDFADSGFTLDCGTRYRVYGRFWAREDRSGRFKVISGDVTSAPVHLMIECH